MIGIRKWCRNRPLVARIRVSSRFPRPKPAPCRAEENDRWAARREAYYRLACLQLEEKRSPVHDAFDPVESNDSDFSPTDGGLW